MLPFNKYPICNNEVVVKNVEKLLRGGKNTAVVKVKAEVCLHCGERLYSKDTITLFEQIKFKLEKQDVSEFQLLGQSYQIIA
jgi:YgiT-type zinc finger domain-containing protein